MRNKLVNSILAFGLTLGLAKSVNADYIKVNSFGGITGTTLNVIHGNKDPPYADGDDDWDSPIAPMTEDTLLVTSKPGSFNLSGDKRPQSSMTPYSIDLIAMDGSDGGNTVTSSNNYLQFLLQSGPDAERPLYDWSISLSNGATFNSGDPIYRAGTWDLATTPSFSSDFYSFSNLAGGTTYGNLILTPKAKPSVPEPSTGLLALLGAGALASRRNKRKI